MSNKDEFCEIVTVEVDKEYFKKEKNIIISVLYHPPGTDLLSFNEYLNILLNTLKNENIFCYLMGDFNINLLNYDRHKGTNEFMDLLHSYSFISLINKPTRIMGDSATLIDNIFTNCYFDLGNTFQCIIKTYITDHFPVIHVDFSQRISKTETYTVR